MGNKSKYDGVDTFVPGIGTVRECIDCGALIAGGPTRCIRCAKEGPPKERITRNLSEFLPPIEMLPSFVMLVVLMAVIVGLFIWGPAIVAWRQTLP
jgi:hypothetical protein